MAKYLKSDSEKGYVEDYVDIQALKFDNVRHTALGNMLGDYDNEGNYVIDTKIVNELIAMPKYVVEVMDNLEICLSVIKFDKQLSFLVAFEGEKVTLSLLEKVSFEANNKLDAGTWSNVNEYVLDVVETVGEVDRNTLYMKWNIQTFPGNLIDIFNCEDGVLAKYFNIINRIKYNMEVKSELLEKEDELEEVEAEYALDMFTILQSYPELLKLIQNQLKKEITEKKDFLKLDKPNFAKTFNELLNKAVDGNIGKLSEFERVNFETDKRNIKIKSNIKKYDVINVQEERYELVEGKTSENKLVKIPAEGHKFKTFETSATGLAKVEKDAENKSTQNATDILPGNKKCKKAELYEVLSKFGIKPENIVSASVMETVRARTLKDLETKTTKAETKETNSKTSSAKASSDKGNDKKKDDKKKTEKKDKKEKKDTKEKKDKKEDKKEEKSASSGGGGGFVGSVTNSKTEKTEASKIKIRTLDEVTKPKNNQAGMLSRMAGNNLKVDLKVGQDFLKREEGKEVIAGANSDTTLNVTSTSVKVSVRQHKVTIQRKDETLNSL